MAESRKSVDITVCGICLEFLDIPKSLPCLHTFCEKCIFSYIKSSLEKGDKTFINCPVCRTKLSAPIKNCSPDDWAKKLPLNFLIVGIIEKQKIERAEKQCMSCERLGTSTTALFVCVECSDALCENCYQYHKANKFTSNHKIVSVSDISEVEKSFNFFKSDCPEHKQEELKLFCVDHDVPCCSLCVSVTHRKCNEVVTLDRAAQDFMSSDIGKNIQQTLGDIEKDVLILMAQNKQCEEGITTQCDTGIRDIDSYFAKLQTRIENVKQNLKDKLIKISNEKMDVVETNITILENLSTKVENEKMILNASLQKASQVQLMLEIKNLKTKHEQHRKAISQIFENTFDYDFVIQCDQDIDKLAKVVETQVSARCDTSVKMLELYSVPTVNLKLKCTITTEYYVIDCFCSSEQLIVILDNNHTLWSHDTDGNYVHKWTPKYGGNYGYSENEYYGYESRSMLVNEHEPASVMRVPALNYQERYDNRMFHCEQVVDSCYGRDTCYLPTAIAEGDSGEIVVAYSNSNTVHFVDQYRNLLSETYISFEHVDNISMHRSQQLLIVSDSANIGIFKKSGDQVLAFGSNGSKYLCINSKSRLYYVESNNIICRTLEGTPDVKINMKLNREINGFTVNPDGKIFVSSTHQNTVSLLSTNGSIFTDVLTAKDGLSKPSLIRCSLDGKTLLVVHKDNTEVLCFEVF